MPRGAWDHRRARLRIREARSPPPVHRVARATSPPLSQWLSLNAWCSIPVCERESDCRILLCQGCVSKKKQGRRRACGAARSARLVRADEADHIRIVGGGERANAEGAFQRRNEAL